MGKDKNQKGLFSGLLIVVIVALAFAGGFLVANNTTSEPAPPPQGSQGPTQPPATSPESGSQGGQAQTQADLPEKIGESILSSQLEVKEGHYKGALGGIVQRVEDYGKKKLYVVSVNLGDIFVDPPVQQVKRGLVAGEDTKFVRIVEGEDGKTEESIAAEGIVKGDVVLGFIDGKTVEIADNGLHSLVKLSRNNLPSSIPTPQP